MDKVILWSKTWLKALTYIWNVDFHQNCREKPQLCIGFGLIGKDTIMLQLAKHPFQTTTSKYLSQFFSSSTFTAMHIQISNCHFGSSYWVLRGCLIESELQNLSTFIFRTWEWGDPLWNFREMFCFCHTVLLTLCTTFVHKDLVVASRVIAQEIIFFMSVLHRVLSP